MQIGQRIKQIRQTLGIRQAGLAKRSGIPEATISRIENGIIKHPKIDTLMKIASAMSTTVGNLLDEIESQ
jgi:transcriptional regulator with XRE-family HTH domain